MEEYWESKCPVCAERLRQGEDIVVCPECGTPYHRACYQREGHCINQELHERHEAWSPERAQQKEEERFEAPSPRRCPKCATLNPPDGIFCQVCGYPLKEDAAAGGEQGPDPIAPNPYTTPYGGVSPDEELGGVSARELALFIGNNSHYFIPRFFNQCAGRVFTWNWPAFWFRGLYFLYRKMYLAGALVLLANLALSVPSTLISLGVALGRSSVFGLELAALYRASTACSLLSLALALGCALFANHIYCRHTLSCVKRLRREHGNLPGQDYVFALARRGRTNRALLLGFIGVWVVASMVISYLLVMFAA